MAIKKPFSLPRRSNSFSGLRVDLDVGRLRSFMLHTIPSYCCDSDLKKSASIQSQILAYKCSKGDALCHDDLRNCLAILSAFLSSNTCCVPPAFVVFKGHSLVGCILESLGQHRRSSQSFLKALWIASSTSEVSVELLALTLHRLGICYGRQGMFKEAKRLLKLALIKYSAASVHQDHVVVVASRDLLDFYGKQVEDEIEQNRFCSSLSGRFNTKLSLIPEEPLTERRKSY